MNKEGGSNFIPTGEGEMHGPAPFSRDTVKHLVHVLSSPDASVLHKVAN